MKMGGITSSSDVGGFGSLIEPGSSGNEPAHVPNLFFFSTVRVAKIKRIQSYQVDYRMRLFVLHLV